MARKTLSTAPKDGKVKDQVLAVIASTLPGPVRYLKIVNTSNYELKVWVSKDDATPLTWQLMSDIVPPKKVAGPGQNTFDLKNYAAITTGVRQFKIQNNGTGSPTATATSGTGFNYSKTATSGTAVYQVSYTAGAYGIPGPTYTS